MPLGDGDPLMTCEGLVQLSVPFRTCQKPVWTGEQAVLADETVQHGISVYGELVRAVKNFGPYEKENGTRYDT